MSRVFRQQYTRPIPEGAERVVLKGKKGKPDRPGVRFHDDAGQVVVAPLTKKGDRCRVVSPFWYGQYADADGIRQRVKLCENKAAAEQMLAHLVGQAGLGRVGLRNPCAPHVKRPLAEHLDDYRRELAARNNAPRYVALVASRLASLFAGCGFVFPPDLSANRAMDWLADLRRKGTPPAPLPPGREAFTAREAAALLGIQAASVGAAVRRNRLAATGQGKARRFPGATVLALQDRFARGASVQTTNDYLSALKSFGRWMVKDDRMTANPFDRLEAGNARVDRRHDRRELEVGELRCVLAAARASARTSFGLAGTDRYHLYATACGTGFRASALASLTPESFDLASGAATVTLSARSNKSRKTKVQPISPDLAEMLKGYLAGKAAGKPVWGGTWARDRRGAEMLKGDLADAGIPYAVEGPDGPLYADFHALRHTYLTLGGRAGIDLRTLQELAGHSTSKLTERYSHRRLYDLQGAVDKLPRMLPDEAPAPGLALPATGTDGAASALQPPVAYTPLTHAPDAKRCSLRPIEGEKGDRSQKQDRPQPLDSTGVEAGCDQLRLCERRAGDGGRTHDSHVGNVALYH